MQKKDSFKGFEWDQGNIDKSFRKHGVSPRESEEVFLDEKLLVVPDVKHQEQELRLIAIGKTIEKKIVFVVFTLRGRKIRVISARRANRREVKIYEEKIKENPEV